MLKKQFLLTTLLSLGCSLQGRTFKLKPFKAAIEAADQKRLTVLFKKNRRKNLSETAIRELVDDVHDTVSDVVDDLHERKRFYKDPFDCAKTLLGGISLTVGILALLTRKSAIKSGAGVVGILVGPWLMYKGITCSSQIKWIDKVNELHSFIDNAQMNTHDESK